MKTSKRRERIEKLLEKKFGDRVISHPEILSGLGKIAESVYFEFYNTSRAEGHDAKKSEAIMETFKKLSISKDDNWPAFYKKNGYIKIFSPLFNQIIAVARDKVVKNKIKKLGVVIYLEEELKFLKGLEREQLLQIHMGKEIYEGELTA